MAEIDLHNAQYGATYQQGMNQFTDMTDDEFKAGPWTGNIFSTCEFKAGPLTGKNNNL